MMKPLQTLDHVMLWAARAFVAALVGLLCFDVGKSLGTLHNSSDILFAECNVVGVAFFGLMGFSLWRYRNPVSRLFLGFVSIVGVVASVQILRLIDPAEIPGDATRIYLLYYALIAGFACVLWSVCRPPKPASETLYVSYHLVTQ